LHEVFKISNERGLSDLLCGTRPPEELETLMISTHYDGLHVLPAGSAPSSISNLLHSPRVFDFLQRMRREFDMVLIDTPPMLQIPDARVLGRLVDGVILVVRSAWTTRAAAATASQRLVGDGTRVLGTVLNEWDPRKTSAAGYGPPYYYRGVKPAAG
jgi:Mrp family chromosome partitioning ATPase